MAQLSNKLFGFLEEVTCLNYGPKSALVSLSATKIASLKEDINALPYHEDKDFINAKLRPLVSQQMEPQVSVIGAHWLAIIAIRGCLERLGNEL